MLMEDLGFVTRLERSGQTADAAEPFRNRCFVAARLPRFSGPRSSWADRSSRRVSRAVAGPPTDRGCKAVIQGAATPGESGGATRATLLPMRAHRETGSSNPLPSSSESPADLGVEVRLTPRAVEIFLKCERIAAHLRASSNH